MGANIVEEVEMVERANRILGSKNERLTVAWDDEVSLPRMIVFLYIDPGSGSYLVQLLVAAGLGVLYFFRTIKLYVQNFFYKIFKGKKRSPKS